MKGVNFPDQYDLGLSVPRFPSLSLRHPTSEVLFGWARYHALFMSTSTGYTGIVINE